MEYEDSLTTQIPRKSEYEDFMTTQILRKSEYDNYTTKQFLSVTVPEERKASLPLAQRTQIEVETIK
jgi:hypothetical protein